MKNKKFPLVSKELIEHLEAIYPDRMPSEGTGLEQIRFLQGQVSVVRLLRKQFQQQIEKVLENN